MKFRKIILILVLFLITGARGFCDSVWINDARDLFLLRRAVVYEFNFRTFNANDKDGDGIIDESKGEGRGTFVNAVERLDELSVSGVNTVLLMPVMSLGKVKAIGTAGSLYAPISFSEINPQLKDNNYPLSSLEQLRKFISECHSRRIRVIVDMPACASYELFMKNPELFKKDKYNNPVTPADWTDVRLLDSGSGDEINQDVYDLYKRFILTMVDLGADGVRADVPSLKSQAFWKKLISETRAMDPQFLFLAESSQNKSVSVDYAPNTSLDKLLDAGFDAFYGGFPVSESSWSANSLYSAVNAIIAQQKKQNFKVVATSDFLTHDTLSPVVEGGKEYARMLLWINLTLPINPIFTDGFSTGDSYLYPMMNRKAQKTFTDDEFYFVHRGKADIFNFSRRLIGPNIDFYREYVLGIKFRNAAADIIADGSFQPLRAGSPSIFAYARTYKNATLLVYGNLDFKRAQNAKINFNKIASPNDSVPIKIISIPKIKKGNLEVNLQPGEVQVIMMNSAK